MKCTVIQQGYGPPHYHCLPNTGLNLMPFMLVVVLIIGIGVLLRIVTKPKRVRAAEWHEEYQAHRDDWESGRR